MKDCTKCPLSSKIMGEPLELENPESKYLMIFDVPTKDENLNGQYVQGVLEIWFEKNSIKLETFSRTSLLKCNCSTDIKPYFEKCRLLLWRDIVKVQPKEILCWGKRVATRIRMGAALPKNFPFLKKLFKREEVKLGNIETTMVYLPSTNDILMKPKLSEQTATFLKDNYGN